MSGSLLLKKVIHVFEVFHVTALVARHGDRLNVFLDGCVDDFLHRTVVAQVNHFAPGGLYDAPHDIDGGIVPIEKAGRGNNPNLVLGDVRLGGFMSAKILLAGLGVSCRGTSTHSLKFTKIGGEKCLRVYVLTCLRDGS